MPPFVSALLFPRFFAVPVLSSFWMVGSIFAATAAWILLGDGFDGSRILPGSTWRHYALIAALPAATALLLTFLFVPESPRFLAKAGASKRRTICRILFTHVVTCSACGCAAVFYTACCGCPVSVRVTGVFP